MASLPVRGVLVGALIALLAPAALGLRPALADYPAPVLQTSVDDGATVVRGTDVTVAVQNPGTTYPLVATWSLDDTEIDRGEWSPGDVDPPSWVFSTAQPGEYDLEVTQVIGDPYDPAVPWQAAFHLTAVLPAPKAQVITATYPATTHALNARAAITGEVRTDTGLLRPGVPVALQVYGGGRWNTTDIRTTSDAAGRYALTAPTFFYGAHTYRPIALAAGGLPAATPVAAAAMTVRLPYTPRGSASAYTIADRPWNPCRAIPVYVNMTGAKKGFTLSLVSQAIARVAAASGLRLRYAGATKMVPLSRNDDRVDRRTGIFIGWASPAQVPSLRGSATVGQGGFAYGGGRVAGYVALDRSQKKWKAGFGGTGTRAGNLTVGGALLHELGHAVGLGHSRDPYQVLYPMGARGGSEWGRGDLAGLSRIGLHGGC